MPTEQEKIAFANAAIEQLGDDEVVQKLQDNVKQLGTWANQVSDSFKRVTEKLSELAASHGDDFPQLNADKNEWAGYNALWLQHLAASRDIASENAAILKRE
ncbi:hypothetical protein MD484_g7775, partial [Candolleomyces efflorescens]